MERKHCTELVPDSTLRYCTRYATHVVLDSNVAVDYFCTQHAKIYIARGTATNVKIVEMQGTK